MMALALVPKVAPTPKEKLRLRIKNYPRPDGALCCPRCGCLTVLTTTQGDTITNGRYQRGTVADDRVCAECWRRGVISPMMPGRIKPV